MKRMNVIRLVTATLPSTIKQEEGSNERKLVTYYPEQKLQREDKRAPQATQ